MPKPTIEEEYITRAIRGNNYEREDEQRSAAALRASQKCTDACNSGCPGLLESPCVVLPSCGSISMSRIGLSPKFDMHPGCVPLSWNAASNGYPFAVLGSLALSCLPLFFASEISKKRQQNPRCCFNFCCAFHGTNHLCNSAIHLKSAIDYGTAASSPAIVTPSVFGAIGACCLAYGCYKQCCNDRCGHSTTNVEVEDQSLPSAVTQQPKSRNPVSSVAVRK